MEELYTIYKIYSKDNKYVYVGSTKNLNDRTTKHIHCSKNKNSKKYNSKVYETIRENGGWNEFIIEKIEEMYCNKKDALIRETELMKILNSNLNSYKAYRSQEELKEQQKEYHIKNKEKMNEYKINNKEKINEQKKEYRMKNKDKLNEKKKNIT